MNALLPGQSLLTAFVAARHETFVPDQSPRALAVGTEVEVPLGQRLTFNAGTQAEGLNDRLFDRKNFAPSAVLPSRDNGEILGGYRMGAALDLGAGLALKAHNGRYHRAPNFFELFGDRGAVIGNTNLVSEEGHNWDLGLVFRRRDPSSGRWSGANSGRGRVLSQPRRRPHSLYTKLTAGVAAPQHGTRLAARRGNAARSAVIAKADAPRQLRVPARRKPHPRSLLNGGNDLPNAPRHRLNTRLSLDLGSAEIYGEFSRESRHFLDRANLRTVPVRALYNFGGTVPLVGGHLLVLGVAQPDRQSSSRSVGLPAAGPLLWAFHAVCYVGAVREPPLLTALLTALTNQTKEDLRVPHFNFSRPFAAGQLVVGAERSLCHHHGLFHRQHGFLAADAAEAEVNLLGIHSDAVGPLPTTAASISSTAWGRTISWCWTRWICALPLIQFSVGNGTNPHDIEIVAPDKAYISRYDTASPADCQSPRRRGIRRD